MTFTDNFNLHLPAILGAVGGDEATYTPQGGSAKTVTGVFDNSYFAYEGNQGVEINASQPRFYCQSSDVTGVQFGDALIVRGNSYKVVDVQPDGQGLTMLALELQP